MPLLCARPAVTPKTVKRAASSFVATLCRRMKLATVCVIHSQIKRWKRRRYPPICDRVMHKNKRAPSDGSLCIVKQVGTFYIWKTQSKMDRFLWLMERGILMIFYVNRCKLVHHTWTMSLHYLVNCRRTYIHTRLCRYLYKCTGRMPFLPPNQQCQSTEGCQV